MNNVKRKEWIDLLRGIAIIMVVLVHTIPAKIHGWYIYNLLVGPVMIPLFFAITGYVFNPRNGNQKAFFINLFQKLVMPSLLLFAGVQLLLIPFSGLRSFGNAMISFLSGKTCWYTMACIIAEVLFFYNLKVCKKQVYVYLTAVVCCVVGFLMDHFDIGHFAMINRAFIAQFFLSIGYLFKNNETFFQRLKWPYLLTGGLIYLAMIAGTFIIWPRKSIDVHLNSYYNIPYCFVLIFTTCVLLMTLASKVGKAPKVLALIGRHTLVIYLFHGYCTAVGKKLLPLDMSSGVITILKVLLIAVFAISACTVAGIAINCLCPWIMGRPKANKKEYHT